MNFFPWQPSYGSYFPEIYFIEKKAIKNLTNILTTEIRVDFLSYSNTMAER